MVFRDVRTGYEDRAFSAHRDLGYRHRARAADNDVRRSHSQRHIVDEFEKFDVRVFIEPRVLEKAGADLVFYRARGVNVQRLRMVRGVPFHHLERRVVHLFRAHTPAV